jgi:hypothetical protein
MASLSQYVVAQIFTTTGSSGSDIGSRSNNATSIQNFDIIKFDLPAATSNAVDLSGVAGTGLSLASGQSVTLISKVTTLPDAIVQLRRLPIPDL